MSRPNTFLPRIAEYFMLMSIILIMVILLPVTDYFFTQSKHLMFVVVGLVITFIYALYSIRKGTLSVILTPILVPISLFGLAVMASTFFTNPYFVENLLGYGGLFLIGVLLVIFGGALAGKFFSQKLLTSLSIGSGLLAITALAQQLGYGPANMINQATGLGLPTNMIFSLAGSTLIATQLIGITLMGQIFETITKKQVSKITAITFPILLIGLALHIWSILPGKPAEQIFPNWAASWSVALDTIRTPRAALIGAGTDSYANMYSKFKPVWMNNTPSWAVVFNQANNTPLTLLTTAGFVGLITWLVLAVIILKQYRKVQTSEGKVFVVMLIGTLILQLIFPPNFLIWIMQVMLLVGYTAAEKKQYPVLKFQAFAMSISRPSAQFPTGVESRTPSLPVYLTGAALLMGTLVLSYFAGRAYAASVVSFEAKRALSENDAVKSYELQQIAVRYNPYYDVFRREYALTNMMVATAIANNAEELAPAEQEQVSGLLQQAVREAQAATVIDQDDVQNWAALAQIYQGMVGAVEGADQWTVQAYVNAINSDPTNPALRVSLGGIFIGQEQLQQAANIFDQAVQIKPDYPNSYYNLAYTLNQLGAFQQSAAAYQTLLTLLEPETEDYKTVMAEYEAVKVKADEQAAAQGTPDAQDTQVTDDNPILDQNLKGSGQNTLNPAVDQDVDLDGTTPLGSELQPEIVEPASEDPTENTESGLRSTESDKQPNESTEAGDEMEVVEMTETGL